MSQFLRAQLEESTLYCGVGIGEFGGKHHLFCVFSNSPRESPAPLVECRTWEVEGFGYPNTHVASEIGGKVRQSQTYHVSWHVQGLM